MNRKSTVHIVPNEEVWFVSPSFDRSRYHWDYRKGVVSCAYFNMTEKIAYDLITNDFADPRRDFHMAVQERHIFGSEAEAKAYCAAQNRVPDVHELSAEELFPTTDLSSCQ